MRRIVTLIGVSRRGKNRIAEHGKQFMINDWDGHSILCESLNDTFSGHLGRKERWTGWFNVDSISPDVEIKT